MAEIAGLYLSKAGIWLAPSEINFYRAQVNCSKITWKFVIQTLFLKKSTLNKRWLVYVVMVTAEFTSTLLTDEPVKVLSKTYHIHITFKKIMHITSYLLYAQAIKWCQSHCCRLLYYKECLTQRIFKGSNEKDDLQLHIKLHTSTHW